MNCTSCGAAVVDGWRFCGLCGAPIAPTQAATSTPAATSSEPAPGAGPSSCPVCGRPYKTERGLRAHLVSVHDMTDTAATAAAAGDGFPPGDSRPDGAGEPGGPWSAPLAGPLSMPPAPAAGPGPSTFPAGPPGPPGYTAPAAPAPYLPPPPPPGAAYAPPAPAQWAPVDQTTSIPVAAPAPEQPWSPPEDQPPELALHLHRPLAPLGNAMNATFGVLIFALLAAMMANGFLFVSAAPDHKWFDTALKVDERMFLILPIQLVLGGLIFVLLLVWLFRAVANQAAFGATRTRLSPAEALALAFVPVVNLFSIKAALSDVWRTADPRVVPGDHWRTRPAPGRLNWLWIAPLLSAAVNVGTAIVVSNRLDNNGVVEADTVDEAKFLYASRGVSILLGIIFINIVRRLLKDVTERQDTAAGQLRVGHTRGWQRSGQAQRRSAPPAPAAAPAPY